MSENLKSKNLISFCIGANESLLENLVSPSNLNLQHSTNDLNLQREKQVQIFVKQLLTALQYMHHRNIVHLDLKPEAILLQDNHLILADFGQSRHLLLNKVSGNIKNSPEFVSPEVVSGGTVTLATDMWSAGVLTYVLLAGISPFLGDNDDETLKNVLRGEYSVDLPELKNISLEAKDFVKNLIVLDYSKRMTVDEALKHKWISDPNLENEKLLTDCLREFKYCGNWLERRVFVQQTFSDEFTSYTKIPSNIATSCEKTNVSNYNSEPLIPKPRAMYDYLKIKDAKQSENAPPLPPKPQNFSALSNQSICGERRQIEEEIINRILSDISEENSTAESFMSADNAIISKHCLLQSRSSTPQNVEVSVSSTTTTPLAFSPGFESNEQQFFNKKETTCNKTPYDIPLFISDDSKHNVVKNQGVKNFQLSPTQEHAMSVIISSTGKENENNLENSVELLPSNQSLSKKLKVEENSKSYAIAQSDNLKLPIKQNLHLKKKKSVDLEFEFLMKEVDEVKKSMKNKKAIEDDLEKYSPKNYFKDKNFVTDKPKLDADSFVWESDYQIGPDTFLLATRDAEFNARVRDYRRELWGDSAPYVLHGILGNRNSDISVRERRRFTDLLKEEPQIAKSVNELTKKLQEKHLENVPKSQPNSTNLNEKNENYEENGGKKMLPTFRARLHDVWFKDNTSSITLTCQVVGNPFPEVKFIFQQCVIQNGGRYKITQKGDFFSLTIVNPITIDSGEYFCLLSNDVGTDQCSCSALYGKIKKPSRPDVELSSDTEVLIRWDPPERLPTTLEGVVYRVECRPASENDVFSKWNIISNRVETECVVIKHLKPLSIYQFRVTAKNNFGWSEPSITSRIIQTHPRGAPKLNLDLLRKELKFAVITLPQKISKRGTGLSEIVEELEEGNEEKIDKDDIDDACSVVLSEESTEKTESDFSSLSQPQQFVTLNTIDDILKRFQLETEVFCGQFSVVRYAVDSKNGMHCVAKIFLPNSANKEVNQENNTTLQEYEALAACQHENVVHLIAAYYNNKILSLFMERLHENIFERFSYPNYYTENQVSFIIKQLASALDWIHFQNIVHLNIEPNNLLFASKRSWLIKIIDFGFAQKTGTKISSSLQHLMNSAEWKAPEIILAQNSKNNFYDSNLCLFNSLINGTTKDLPKSKIINGLKLNSSLVQEINPKIDVWGLGLLTFCLLGGLHPFATDDEDEEEIKKNVIHQRCNPNLIPVQASEEALRFVTWALKKDPLKRMTTKEALTHRFLSCNPVMIRRRENIRYNTTVLRRTTARQFRRVEQFQKLKKNLVAATANNLIRSASSGYVIPPFKGGIKT